MKILKVIHGYPIRYNAGSEVYTQTLCHELVKRHDVCVFSRIENPFLPDYAVVEEKDTLQEAISLRLVNLPLEKHRYRYRDPKVDLRFKECLETFKPDVIHIGHLNHLSCSLVEVAKKFEIPIFFTLHDFWLLCPRGQFLQRRPTEEELYPLCDGQEDEKCAKACFACYHSGSEEDQHRDEVAWT
ncbi:MAG: glycosyltransferase, partial [Chlamydiia bacterium]|nr:glycosyltransferase [Chlamydiia bacterium]